jgi:hypothetical protein
VAPEQSHAIFAILLAAAIAAVAVRAASAIASRLWMGFVDVKRSAVQVLTIERGDGVVAFDVVGHLDKSEPSGSSRVAVGYDIHTIHASVACKERTDSLFRGPKTEVTYKDVFHYLSFWI